MGIYYIGHRETDIAINFDATVTDNFFEGSITEYGRNENGNVAYNATSGIQLDISPEYDEHNGLLLKNFIENQCRAIVARDKDAKFLPYSYYFAVKIPPEYTDRVICANDNDLLFFLNSKFKFKRFIKGKLPEAKFVLESGTTVIKKLQNGTYPDKKEVVIQTEYGEGGFGTVLCTKNSPAIPEMFDASKLYVVSDFIPNICSVAIHVLIADDEIAVYPPSVQLLRGACYAGSDLAKFAELDDYVKDECYRIAVEFGKLLQTRPEKPRGYFGIDALISSETPHKVYVVETNPRFTGTVGLLNIISHKVGAGSIYEHTYRCFTHKKLPIEDIEKITPSGRKIYTRTDWDGKSPKQLEEKNINHDGIDKTVIRGDRAYLFSIFEEVRDYNTFDIRNYDRTYISQVKKGTKNKK
jgi:hypothetical protein